MLYNELTQPGRSTPAVRRVSRSPERQPAVVTVSISTKRKRGKNLPAISSFSSRSGTRTRVSTVRGWRANRYTNRPLFQTQGAVSPCFRVQSYCLLAKLPNLSAKKIRLFSSRAITQLNINQIKNTQIQALPYRAFFIPLR